MWMLWPKTRAVLEMTQIKRPFVGLVECESQSLCGGVASGALTHASRVSDSSIYFRITDLEMRSAAGGSPKTSGFTERIAAATSSSCKNTMKP